MARLKLIKKTTIEEERDRLLEILSVMDPTDENYMVIAENLGRIAYAGAESSKQGIDRNLVIGVLANLTGMLLVLYFEQAHVLASKAFGMVIKPRL